jgi:hypothetical protein
MAETQIVPGLYVISAGPVNTFLLESSDGCTVIGTGLPGSADKILQSIMELGKATEWFASATAKQSCMTRLASSKKSGPDTLVNQLDHCPQRTLRLVPMRM